MVHRRLLALAGQLRGPLAGGIAVGWVVMAARVTQAALTDVEALEWFYAHTIAQCAVTVLTPIAAIGVIAGIDLRLAATLLPFAALIITVPFWLIRLGDRQGVTLRTQLGALHAEAVDGVHGLRELVLFGQAQEFRRRLRLRGRALQRPQLANGSRMGVENGVTDGLVAMAMLAVLTVGAVLRTSGELSPAAYPVAVILAGFSLLPLTEITGGIRNLGVLRATASRVFTVIAHRLSTIRTADRVVVLESGRVVQQGRHHELAAVDGPYRRLLASQVESAPLDEDRQP
jgi:ATP-binding cassette, subfamily C, bacterial CydC